MFTDIKNYLSQNSVINEKYVPYYLKWVTVCCSFLDLSLTYSVNVDQRNNSLILFKNPLRLADKASR